MAGFDFLPLLKDPIGLVGLVLCLVFFALRHANNKLPHWWPHACMLLAVVSLMVGLGLAWFNTLAPLPISFNWVLIFLVFALVVLVLLAMVALVWFGSRHQDKSRHVANPDPLANQATVRQRFVRADTVIGNNHGVINIGSKYTPPPSSSNSE